MVNNIPPPPPAPPGGFSRGGGGGPGPGPGPQVHQHQQPQQQHFQPQQQPNHNMGFPPSQIPIRTQSHRISNLQTQRPLDETACLKELTTYKAYTLQKIEPVDRREKATWGRVDIQEERLAQDDLIKAINKLKSDKQHKSVSEKKLALKPNQSAQVTNILDDLISRERDYNYEWTLTQMASKISKNKKGQPETVAMTIYFKRAPVKDANVMSLYQQHVERQVQREQNEKMKEQERRQREQQMRAEHQFQEQQMREHRMREMQAQAHAQQQQQQNNNRGGAPQVVTLDRDRGRRNRSASSSRSRSGNRRRKSRNNRKSDRRYDSDDLYDSESSDSDFSSNDTSISSRDRRSDKHHRKDKHSGRKAIKYHRKSSYNVDVPRSPRAAMQSRYAVPEVPRPPIGPQYDQVEAAYQAGLQDADAEHYALEKIEADRQLMARDRQAAYDTIPRHMPPLREEAYRPRTIIEGPMPLDRALPRRLSGAGPRAVVSFGTEEGIRGRPSLAPRVYSESARYIDSRQDTRDYVEEDRLYRQERRAHEHIDGRRAEPLLARRPSFYRRASAYEPVIHQSNPFAPRDLPYRERRI